MFNPKACLHQKAYAQQENKKEEEKRKRRDNMSRESEKLKWLVHPVSLSTSVGMAKSTTAAYKLTPFYKQETQPTIYSLVMG